VCAASVRAREHRLALSGDMVRVVVSDAGSDRLPVTIDVVGGRIEAEYANQYKRTYRSGASSRLPIEERLAT